MRYSLMWKTVSCLLAFVGAIAALVFVPLSINAIVFMMTAAIVGSIKFSLDLAADRPARRAARRAMPIAAGAGLTVLAVCGYAASTGVATAALITLVAASSPPVASHLFPRTSNAADPSEATSGSTETTLAIHVPGPDAQALHDFTDLELCTAWRRSYLSLQRATSLDERLEIVVRPQGYLDELERRGPYELAEWLRMGARAAGDPSKYFPRDVHRPS